MSTGAALAFLDRKITALHKLPKAIKAAAPEAAEATRAELTRSLNAGKSPDGAAWAPRKADGGRAYAGAADALSVTASGNIIVADITGPEVYGHRGVRGAKPRRMLPSGGIPSSLAAVLVRLGIKLFHDQLG